MRGFVRRTQTLQPTYPLLITLLVSSGGLSTQSWSGPLTTTAQAGFNPAVVVADGGSASASDSFNGLGGISVSSSAFASPAGLSVFVTSTGYAPTGAQYAAGASFSVVNDTTFNYQTDYMGGQNDWVEVGLTGGLSGSIVGEKQGGTGSARARISISGNIWTAPQDEGGVFIGSKTADSGDRGGSVRSSSPSQVIDINEFVSTGYFWIPRGDAVTIAVSLSATVFSDHNPFGAEAAAHGTVTANFADTFEFDPYSFFDILTPGVTANSPSLGLVNNQLVAFIDTGPSAVPTPSALPLMASGLVILGVIARRRSVRSSKTAGRSQ